MREPEALMREPGALMRERGQAPALTREPER